MTTLAPPQIGHSAQTLFEPAQVTLEDVILGAWEDLRLEGRAECPVCGEEMAHAGCDCCGAVLK